MSAATTRDAATCSYTDVNTLVSASADGDTVNVPGPCSSTWTSGITITGKGISIIGGQAVSGYGGGTTTITASVKHLFVLQPSYGNSLMRISNLTILPGTGADNPIYPNGTCAAGGCPNVRIDHITFPAAWGSAGAHYASMVMANNVFGVLDHNTVGTNGVQPCTSVNSNCLNLANVNFSAWQGVGYYGDKSWASPTTLGTGQSLYLEDNTVYGGFGTDTEGNDAYEGGSGGRLVCRFNTFYGLAGVSACGGHGTETGGRPRGMVQAEFYGNSVTTGAAGGGAVTAGLGMRSGVGVQFGNVFASGGTAIQDYLANNDERVWRMVPFGWCNGTNPYDVNDGATLVGNYTVASYAGGVLTLSSAQSGPWPLTTNAYIFNAAAPGPKPYYLVYNTTNSDGGDRAGVASNTTNALTLSWRSDLVAGSGIWGGATFQAGDTIALYSVTAWESGTVTAGGTGLADSTKAWTSNQWYAYSYIDVASGKGGYSTQITTNGTTSASGHTPADRNQVVWTGFVIGEPYIITRATKCLDQPTVNGGTLLSGTIPAPLPATAQTTQLTYQGGDTGPAPTNGYATHPDNENVLPNRDFYGMNPSYNSSPTTGTGYGTRTSRPGNCTAGTGYFSTDAGTWNTSGKTFGPSGAFTQGSLDICTATNVWTNAVYTPYSYPHPLITGGSGPTAPVVTTTAPASNVTSTGAAVGGTVTSDGGAAVTARGTCYSTSVNPATPCTSDGTGTGNFNSSLAGLSPNTLYHYRAFATNTAGTSYGSDQSFTTTPVGDGVSISGAVTYSGETSDK